MKARRRAFTLAELMVYIAVLSVFTTALYSVLILSMRHFRLSEARSDSMQAGLKAVSAINRSLASGATSTLQVQLNPPAVMFLSAEPTVGSSFAINSDGELLWQKWVCYHYQAQNRRLMMSFQTITPNPNLPTAPTFATMVALPSRVVARDITNMELTLINSGTVSYTITTGVVPATSSSLASGQNLVGVTTSGYFTLRN